MVIELSGVMSLLKFKHQVHYITSYEQSFIKLNVSIKAYSISVFVDLVN